MDEDEFTRLPPHDVQAERLTLAAMLSGPGGPSRDVTAEYLARSAAGSDSAVEDVAEILEPDDFYRPAHQVIFAAILRLWAGSEPVTVLTLREYLSKRGEMRALGGEHDGAMYLAGLYGLPVPSATAAAHAQIVFDRSVRRKAIERATRVIQAAYSLDQDPAEVALLASAELAEVPAVRRGDPAGRMMTAAQFAQIDSLRTEPVITGMLHREERVIIVAEEGHGKSFLSLQVGFTAAAGLHPFRHDVRFPGRRVLVIDLENPRGEVRDRMAMFGALAARYPEYDPDNILVWSWPQGVDLRKGSDARMVAEHIRQARPDIVLAGPVYNMIADTGEHSEQVHSTVTRFWNTMRGRYGFATWLEHHAPMQQGRAPRLMRPQGSGVYSRWPEFGKTLIANGEKGVVAVGRFRGDRIRNRPWPTELRRHEFYGQDWPWQAHKWPEGALQQTLDES
jgi:AAA domain-containing protein/DnaB helicase-like protein